MSCKVGCTCHNSTDYQPCTPEPICYNGCTSSSCAYDIFSKCPTWPDDYYITRLWRHCLYDLTGSGGFNASGLWSSRSNCAGTGTFPGGSVANAECIASGETSTLRPYNPQCGGAYIGDMLLGCGQPPIVNGTSCTGCTWSENDLLVTSPVWVLSLDGPPPGGYPPPGPTTGTNASITVYIPDCSNPPGTICSVASYTIAPTATDANPGFNCLGRTSFRKGNSGTCYPAYQDVYDRLPQEICVVASASEWSHPCGTGNAEICDCKDSGCSTITLDLTVTCDETIHQTLGMSRITGGCLLEMFGHDLCASITWPSATCGVFAGSIDRSCGGSDQRGLLFLVWCSGGTWTIRTYCVLADATTLLSVTQVDEHTIYRTNECPLTFDPVAVDVSSSDCCATCDCTSCTAPGTLNFAISGPGSGSFTAAGGPTYCGTVDLTNGDHMSIEWNATTCAMRVNCNGGTDCVTFNCLVFPTVTANDCDPYDMTVTFSGGGFLCAACGAGTWTVHIYE